MKKHLELELENATFPPDIDNGYVKVCLSKFKEATSNESLHFVECGVCCEMVREYEKFDFQEIPGRELLTQEEYEGVVLSEYQHDDLIFSGSD